MITMSLEPAQKRTCQHQVGISSNGLADGPFASNLGDDLFIASSPLTVAWPTK